VFESVTVWVAEPLTVTFPKLTALGVILMAGADSLTPVPVKPTARGVLVALLLIEILAEAFPAFIG
jgi:hypothetical protein